MKGYKSKVAKTLTYKGHWDYLPVDFEVTELEIEDKVLPTERYKQLARDNQMLQSKKLKKIHFDTYGVQGCSEWTELDYMEFIDISAFDWMHWNEVVPPKKIKLFQGLYTCNDTFPLCNTLKYIQ